MPETVSGLAKVRIIVFVVPAGVQPTPAALVIVAEPGPLIANSEPVAVMELHRIGTFVCTVSVVQTSDALLYAAPGATMNVSESGKGNAVLHRLTSVLLSLPTFAFNLYVPGASDGANLTVISCV